MDLLTSRVHLELRASPPFLKIFFSHLIFSTFFFFLLQHNVNSYFCVYIFFLSFFLFILQTLLLFFSFFFFFIVDMSHTFFHFFSLIHPYTWSNLYIFPISPTLISFSLPKHPPTSKMLYQSEDQNHHMSKVFQISSRKKKFCVQAQRVH